MGPRNAVWGGVVGAACTAGAQEGFKEGCDCWPQIYWREAGRMGAAAWLLRFRHHSRPDRVGRLATAYVSRYTIQHVLRHLLSLFRFSLHNSWILRV